MSDVIVAFDPGGTTGVAVKVGDDYHTTTATSPLEVYRWFLDPKPDRVVFEIFSTQGRVDKYMIYTIVLVGGIKAACEVLNIPGYAHTPQTRKAFIEEARQILRGKRHVIHEVDALAHLLAHEYKRKKAGLT